MKYENDDFYEANASTRAKLMSERTSQLNGLDLKVEALIEWNLCNFSVRRTRKVLKLKYTYFDRIRSELKLWTELFSNTFRVPLWLTLFTLLSQCYLFDKIYYKAPSSSDVAPNFPIFMKAFMPQIRCLHFVDTSEFTQTFRLDVILGLRPKNCVKLKL